MAAAGLKYPVVLHKMELSNQEIKNLIESKVKAIWGDAFGIEIDKDMKNAIEALMQLLALRTNKDGEQLDKRLTISISHHQDTGTIPDALTSPKNAALQDRTYVKVQKKAYHEEQLIIFSLLIDHGAVAGTNVKISAEKKLLKDGTELTHEELCNTLDEATKTFMQTHMQHGSITSGIRDRDEIRKIYDSCLIVVTKRKAVSETFEDNILCEKDYKKWAKHVKMIASFGALTVALKRLVP